MDEKEKRIENLEEKMQHAFKCKHVACCMYGKWDQCYNHSHVLYEHFESYYDNIKNRNI